MVSKTAFLRHIMKTVGYKRRLTIRTTNKKDPLNFTIKVEH